MSQFFNFGFESGRLTGWTIGGGFRKTSDLPDSDSYLPGASLYDLAGCHVTVTKAGFDSRTDNVLSKVHDGAHAVMINNSGAGAGVSVVSQHVDAYTAAAISFSYAGVLEKAHRDARGDGFGITLTDDTTGEVLFDIRYSSATAARTFALSSTNWLYQDWQTVEIDTSARQGHAFTLTVIAYDCSQRGHAGYVYLDGFEPPSGSIAGTLFADYDRDGVWDGDEPMRAGWTVYVDSNGDNQFNAGEIAAVTDADGAYLLEGVPIGVATIRVDTPARTWENWQSPALTVTVAENQTVSGVEIGLLGGATPFADRLSSVGRRNDVIDALEGDDRVLARGGDDQVSGGDGNDLLSGGAGADSFDGGAGRDRIVGGSGDDLLAGGEGNDRLAGKGGADVFFFAAGSGRDRIVDFSHAAGDQISIDMAGVDDFSDVILTERAGGTVISFSGSGDHIYLRGIDPATLVAGDFVF